MCFIHDNGVEFGLTLRVIRHGFHHAYLYGFTLDSTEIKC